MASQEYIRPGNRATTGGLIALMLIFLLMICGCLQIEPEKIPPRTASPLTATPGSPIVPANMTENTSSSPPEITITSPKETGLFTEKDYPPEVIQAVNDFAEGKTTNTINGFLRWESVRARTNQSDAARISDQIRRIDYAMFNTTAEENISVYVGVSREQAKRIRNESVFSEEGYIIASYDPSVVYQQLVYNGRDSEGYVTMCVIDFRKGNRLLFVNATEREFLLPHGGIWDFAREDEYETLEFSANAIPRYKDIPLKKVRLISTKEHP